MASAQSPVRRGNPYIRILFSLILAAFMVYYVVERRPKRTVAPSEPFPAGAISNEGSGRFAWIPQYPEAPLGNIHTRRTRTESDYGFEFATKDPMNQVAAFYEARLREKGFTVQARIKGGTETDLHAESPDRKRLADITITQTPQLTAVTVSAVEK